MGPYFSRTDCSDLVEGSSMPEVGVQGTESEKMLAKTFSLPQRTLTYFVRGSTTVRLFNSLDSAALPYSNNNICSCSVESNPVKLETNRTVILPPT